MTDWWKDSKVVINSQDADPSGGMTSNEDIKALDPLGAPKSAPVAASSAQPAAQQGSDWWKESKVVGKAGDKGGDQGATPPSIWENFTRVRNPALLQLQSQARDLTADTATRFPGWDWNSGVDFTTLTHFYGADNDKERALALDWGVKKGLWSSYGQKDGEWYVMKKGVPTSVGGEGPPGSSGRFLGTWKSAIAADTGRPLETLGMVAASAVPEARVVSWLERLGLNVVRAGAMETGATVDFSYAVRRLGTGTAYNLTRAAMVAAGATVGATADDAGKLFDGLWDKSTEEEKGMLATAAVTGLGSEIFPRVFGSAFRTVGNLYGPVTDPKQREMVMDLLKRGLVPRIKQAVPASKLLPFEQQMSEFLMGGVFPAEKKNIKILTGEIAKKLEEMGLSADEAKASTARIMGAYKTKIDSSETSGLLQTEAKSRVKGEQSAIQDHFDMLNMDLKKQFDALDKIIGSPDPATQKITQDALKLTRIKFGHEVGATFRAGEAAMHKEGIAAERATGTIKELAQEMIDDPATIVRDVDGRAVTDDHRKLEGFLSRIAGHTDEKGVVHGGLKDLETLTTLQGLRSQLFQMGHYGDLTPGHEESLYNKLGRAIDDAIDAPIPGGEQSEAVRLLKQGRAEWRDGIQKFKNLTVKQLAADVASGNLKDPGMIADMVFNPRHGADFAQNAHLIHGMVDPETWDKIVAGYWGRLRDKATSIRTGKIDPGKFHDLIMKQGKLLDEAFGPNLAAEIRYLGKKNAALAGELDPAQLQPDTFKLEVERYHKRKAALDEKLKDSYIQMLMRGGSDAVDAIDFMMEPQFSNRIERAKREWGEGTPQWQKIKGEAMQKILSHAVTSDESLTNALLVPKKLSGALSVYTDKQLNDLFGKEAADDLRKLARQIDIVMGGRGSRGQAMTGALAASQIVLHPLGHLSSIAQLYVQGQIMAQPWFIRWLSNGMSTGVWRNIDKVGMAVKAMIYATTPKLTPGDAYEAAGETADAVGRGMWNMGKFAYRNLVPSTSIPFLSVPDDIRRITEGGDQQQ